MEQSCNRVQREDSVDVVVALRYDIDCNIVVKVLVDIHLDCSAVVVAMSKS